MLHRTGDTGVDGRNLTRWPGSLTVSKNLKEVRDLAMRRVGTGAFEAEEAASAEAIQGQHGWHI